MTLPWDARLNRERARTEQQRADRARRRADTLMEGARELGGQQAVANHLGISKQAVSKDIRAGDAGGDRLADYIELDLPRTAAAVPTPAEWEALPEGERQAAARRAAAAWYAIAMVAAEQAARAHQEAESLAEALLDTAAPEGRGDIRCRLLADLADAWNAQRKTAWRERDRWQVLAGDIPPSVVFAS